MASAVYNVFKKDLLDQTGSFNLASDTIKVMLVTSTYSPNIDSHKTRADVTNEVSGSGYSAGGSALANKAVTEDDTNDRGKFDADDLTWATSTITARAGVIYKSNGGASSGDPLIAYVDFGSNISSTGGNFTITWDAAGILTLS